MVRLQWRTSNSDRLGERHWNCWLLVFLQRRDGRRSLKNPLACRTRKRIQQRSNGSDYQSLQRSLRNVCSRQGFFNVQTICRRRFQSGRRKEFRWLVCRSRWRIKHGRRLRDLRIRHTNICRNAPRWRNGCIHRLRSTSRITPQEFRHDKTYRMAGFQAAGLVQRPTDIWRRSCSTPRGYHLQVPRRKRLYGHIQHRSSWPIRWLRGFSIPDLQADNPSKSARPDWSAKSDRSTTDHKRLYNLVWTWWYRTNSYWIWRRYRNIRLLVLLRRRYRRWKIQNHLARTPRQRIQSRIPATSHWTLWRRLRYGNPWRGRFVLPTVCRHRLQLGRQ